MADLIQLAVINGTPTTTSLAIAERFGKRHADVLRAIENLSCSQEFLQRNIALQLQEVPGPNGSMRTYHLYTVTKNGFAFLVMGFTGKEAAAWKERYIEAFDAMESQLRIQSIAPLVQVMDLNRQCKRQINQRAWRLGGPDNFERCRAYLIEQVQLAATSGWALSDRWFEDAIQNAKYQQPSISSS